MNYKDTVFYINQKVNLQRKNKPTGVRTRIEMADRKTIFHRKYQT